MSGTRYAMRVQPLLLLKAASSFGEENEGGGEKEIFYQLIVEDNDTTILLTFTQRSIRARLAEGRIAGQRYKVALVGLQLR